MRLAELARPIPVVIASVAVIAACLAIFRPWRAEPSASSSAAAPSMASPLPIADAGDAAAPGVAASLAPALREQFSGLAGAPAPHEASERALALISGSIPEDFSALEALMRRLGGSYAAKDSDWELTRRWWRAVPRSNRPEFAVEMSDWEWENWIDRAGPADLMRLPDDTRAAVRVIDTERIRSATFDALDPSARESIDAILREIARESGFSTAERARIVGYQGRFRYRPPDLEEAKPTMFVAVFVPGMTIDDRDFVAAYIFAFWDGKGWFPYFVKSLSQHRETTPIRRRIPFIPAF